MRISNAQKRLRLWALFLLVTLISLGDSAQFALAQGPGTAQLALPYYGPPPQLGLPAPPVQLSLPYHAPQVGGILSDAQAQRLLRTYTPEQFATRFRDFGSGFQRWNSGPSQLSDADYKWLRSRTPGSARAAIRERPALTIGRNGIFDNGKPFQAGHSPSLLRMTEQTGSIPREQLLTIINARNEEGVFKYFSMQPQPMNGSMQENTIIDWMRGGGHRALGMPAPGTAEYAELLANAGLESENALLFRREAAAFLRLRGAPPPTPHVRLRANRRGFVDIGVAKAPLTAVKNNVLAYPIMMVLQDELEAHPNSPANQTIAWVGEQYVTYTPEPVQGFVSRASFAGAWLSTPNFWIDPEGSGKKIKETIRGTGPTGASWNKPRGWLATPIYEWPREAWVSGRRSFHDWALWVAGYGRDDGE